MTNFREKAKKKTMEYEKKYTKDTKKNILLLNEKKKNFFFHIVCDVVRKFFSKKKKIKISKPLGNKKLDMHQNNLRK